LVEGHFNFDNAGIAEILSAPAWSVAALADVERRLATLRNVLENQSISDAVADQWVDRTVADLRVRGRDYDRLADAVAARIKGKPRNKALSALLIMLSIVGGLVTIREGAELAMDAVEWIGEVTEENNPAKVGPSDGDTER
jgi:hypothetical protein